MIRLDLFIRRNIACRLVGTFTKEIGFHLAGKVLACLDIRQIQPHFVDQHSLVFDPLAPSLLGNIIKIRFPSSPG